MSVASVTVVSRTNFLSSELHLPQKHKATVPESSLRVEMYSLEEQADNAKARDLYWKPLWDND